jgi:N-acetylmuramoyl-L-alanine amidase
VLRPPAALIPLLLLVLAAPAARGEPDIVDRPISWTREREALTVAYRRAHQDPAVDHSRIEPRVIVLHYTGGSSWKATWRYFDRTRLERGRAQLRKGGEVNVSAHFLVDRDGTIYRLLPETTMARHCIGLNHVAIGIENVGDGSRWPLTAAQVAANAALVRHLAGRHAITHLIGHSESNAMRRHPYWRERDPSYKNAKSDPGRAFLHKVRARLADLALEGPPGDN